MVKTCITGITDNFYDLLNLPKRNFNMFWTIAFDNERFLMVMFNCFMEKLIFMIENKVVFNSSIICGELFNLMLKNFSKVCPKHEVRAVIIKSLKKN